MFYLFKEISAFINKPKSTPFQHITLLKIILSPCFLGMLMECILCMCKCLGKEELMYHEK